MSKRPYSTLDEIEFLDGIMESAWKSNVSKARVLKTLQGYAKTALNRNWPVGVCGKTAKNYAEFLIGKLNSQAKI